MATVTGPAKGSTAPLAFSAGSTGRLLAGLAWSPKASSGTGYKIPPLKDAQGQYDTFYFFKLPYYIARAVISGIVSLAAPKIPAATAKADPHDLDLFCYIFDRDFAMKQVVGPKDADVIDYSGKIYHSGENQTGRTTVDAEQIFVETRELPADYQHLFFVVRSANRHAMGDIPDGSMRLVESAANQNLLQTTIAAKAMPPGNSYGYVFCRISRTDAGWELRNYDSFAGREVDWNLLLPALDLK